MKSIYDLIKDNQWNILLEMSKNNKIDYEKYYNQTQNTILHYAALQNNYKFLKTKIDKLDVFENIYNETPLITLALNGYSDTLLKLLPKINPQNIHNTNQLIKILYNNVDLINYFFDNKIKFNYDMIIELNIRNTVYQNDANHKIIKLIIDKIDIIHSEHILTTVFLKKIWLIDDILNTNFQLDIILGNNTLLYHMLSIDYKIFKKLIKKGADINFKSLDSETLVKLAINKKNYKCLLFLLKHNYDVNSFNSMLETDAMIIMASNNIPKNVIEETIKLADMNKKGYNNMTCLLILAITNKLTEYYDILETKELNIFVKSGNGKTVFDFIEDKNEFNKMIVNSYINHLSKLDNYKCLDNLVKCRKKILDRIYDKKRSIPNMKDLNKIINVDVSDDMFKGFSSDYVSGFIYLTFLLDKYKGQLCVPISMSKTDYEPMGNKVIDNIMESYYTHFNKFVPYYIIWGDSNTFYKISNLCDYLMECKKRKERYILLKLTIYNMENKSLHANMILIDKKNNTIERFDPYGGLIHNKNFDDLDSFLYQIGKECINQDVIYYNPQDLFQGFGPQVFSRENADYYKHINDPFGFCMAWGIWYIELRLKNPELSGKTVLQTFMDKMDKTEKSFIKYIRQYAAKLTHKKEDIMKIIGFNKSDFGQTLWYFNDIKKISSYLNKIYM